MNNFYNQFKKLARALSLVLIALCAWSYASMAQVSVTATAGTLGAAGFGDYGFLAARFRRIVLAAATSQVLRGGLRS